MRHAATGKQRIKRRGDHAKAAGLLAALSVAAATLMMAVPLRGADQPLPEYQVKAAWLLNFARFIEWPSDRFPSAHAPFVLGIVGEDPFGKDLEYTLQGKTAKGRSFVLKRLSAEQDLKACHIVFISSSERRKQRDLCAKLKQTAVLTVSDIDDFVANGGMINFVRKDTNVRFQINLDAAEPAGLKISAQLLKVAATVKGKYAAGKE